MQYEANKNYTWQPQDKFEITGKDLELMHNGLSIVSTLVKEDTTRLTLPQLLSLVEAYKAIHNRFVSYVEQDLIKPSDPPQQ